MNTQALWADSWLHANANIGELLPGLTYIFEAVYSDNVVVVPYPFEGLVLLAVVDENGVDLPATRSDGACGFLHGLAQRLGVVAAPSVRGSWEELQAALSSRATASPASFEGWVVARDRDGSRFKLVQESYMRSSLARRRLHPLLVWDAVCFGGSSFAEMSLGLAPRLRRELGSMLDAMADRFCELKVLLHQGAAAANQVESESAATVESRTSPIAEEALATLLEQTLVLGSESGLGSSSRSSAPFLKALSYLRKNDTAVLPSSMFCPGRQELRAIPAASLPLRRLILDCMQPEPDGSMDGYTPSRLFKQTLAKGWAKGPDPEENERVSQLLSLISPPHIFALTSDVLTSCFEGVRGRDLVRCLQASSKIMQMILFSIEVQLAHRFAMIGGISCNRLRTWLSGCKRQREIFVTVGSSMAQNPQMTEGIAIPPMSRIAIPATAATDVDPQLNCVLQELLKCSLSCPPMTEEASAPLCIPMHVCGLTQTLMHGLPLRWRSGAAQKRKHHEATESSHLLTQHRRGRHCCEAAASALDHRKLPEPGH